MKDPSTGRPAYAVDHRHEMEMKVAVSGGHPAYPANHPRSSLPGARWLAAIVMLAGAMWLAPRPAQAQSVGAIRGLERELAADVVRDSVGSISAAVFAGDAVAWRGAFGWADRSSRRLATPGTIYRAGSISKIVTALVLLRLVEEGVVSLDESVSAHLPELGGLAGPHGSRARDITFRQLATHTSGLAREPDGEGFDRGAFREWKRKAVAAIPETRAVAPPGSRYRYSNIGYGLLGFALERAAGHPFEVLADSLVFRPLGMRSTWFVVPSDDRERLATGYVNLPGDTADPRVPRAEHRGRGYRVPSGGLYSTVEDLARLGMAITGAVPLLPDSLRRVMLTDTRSGSDGMSGAGSGAGYGLGVQLIELGTAHLAGHSGTVPGYAAYLLVDPARGTGVVLLRNHNRGATNLGAAATRVLLDPPS